MVCAAGVTALALACGGSDNAATVPVGTDAGPSTFTIGGTITGLPTGSTIGLLNNGGDLLTRGADGEFVFTTLAKEYAVTVVSSPAGYTCSVADGVGVATNHVRNIRVTCAYVAFELGGVITGLPANDPAVLRNNGTGDLTLSANGPFKFPGLFIGPYAITAAKQPRRAACVVTKGSGNQTATVSDVTVTCTPVYFIGGKASGLPGSSAVVLQNNGGDDLVVTADVPFQFATGSVAYSVTIKTQPVGATCKITNGTGTATADVTNVALTCLLKGTLDLTFGGTGTGWIRVQPNANANEWYGLVVNPDDSMVLAGRDQVGVSDEDWVVSKLTPSGTLDAAFATAGHLRINRGAVIGESAKALRRAGDGTLYVAGQVFNAGTDFDFAVAKVSAAGALVGGYGTSGLAAHAVAGAQHAEDMFLYPDGSTLVVGRNGNDTNADMLIAKFTAAGALDTNFGTGGVVAFGTAGVDDEATSVAVDSTGAIVVAGFSGDDSVILKLTSAGAFVTGFGTNGAKTIDLSGGARQDRLRRVVIGASDAILVGGATNNGADTDFLLARFTSGGLEDATFGSAGVVRTDRFNAADTIQGLRIAPDGTILFAGNSAKNGVVGRLNTNGTPDTTFSFGGYYAANFGTATVMNDVGVDSQGRVVTAGSFAATNADFGAARFNP
jgi:uncharacterized delta-60 repeat protein